MQNGASYDSASKSLQFGSLGTGSMIGNVVLGTNLSSTNMGFTILTRVTPSASTPSTSLIYTLGTQLTFQTQNNVFTLKWFSPNANKLLTTTLSSVAASAGIETKIVTYCSPNMLLCYLDTY